RQCCGYVFCPWEAAGGCVLRQKHWALRYREVRLGSTVCVTSTPRAALEPARHVPVAPSGRHAAAGGPLVAGRAFVRRRLGAGGRADMVPRRTAGGPLADVRVVVTDAETQLGLHVIRALGRAGCNITAIAVDTPRVLGFSSRHAHQRCRLSHPEELWTA